MASWAERCQEMEIELATLKRVHAQGAADAITRAAMQVINEHGLTNEFVEKLTAEIRAGAIAPMKD